uniref:Ribosomal protein L6 n=1 Tax=Monomastix sp. (strain OKE-1) TaxID=141716 RepID=U5YGG4_MONSK|nr:ribosomal protein L6 [Monomastix sp. OKE-1]AGZ90210.1 ribosomal protein L6 [Monomastix sp. OKE-1]
MQKNTSVHFLNQSGCFHSHSIKIPSDIKLEIVEEGLPSSHHTHSVLKCTGPLGCVHVNLQKIDKYGLCFFEIIEKQSSQGVLESFLHVSIKSFSDFNQKKSGKKSTHTIAQQSLAFSNVLTSMCQQMIEGVSKGFVLYLELHGVGFRASVHEKTLAGKTVKYLEFKLGQSHDIFFEIPDNIQIFSVKPTLIGLYGIDKEGITQLAAKMRHLKVPDSYKGKGIRYKDESVKTKIGKKK